MICTQCRLPAHKLTEAFEASALATGSNQPQQLCNECLVGRTVPIYRTHIHQWQVGDIDEFDHKTGMHHFIFPDSEDEWLKVETNPFSSYLKHHKALTKLANHMQGQEGTESTKTFSNLMRFDDRDDADAYYNRTQDRNIIAARNQTEVPSKFGRGKKQERVSEELSTVPTSIWVEHPKPHKDEMTFQPQWRPWTWPSFGRFGGTTRVHPGQFPNRAVTGYDPNHNNSVLSDECKIRNSDIAAEPPRKSCPRFWTVEEDNLLMAAVESKGGGGERQESFKWPLIAKCIPGRTGKQCRERYLNHLKPRVKLNRWSAVEDSVAFTLFQSFGSRWAMISKFIPGRTDNGVKNRVHFLKRRLDQHLVHVAGNSNSRSGNDAPLLDSENLSKESGEILQKLQLMLAHLDGNSSVMDGDFQSMMSEYHFGPFRSLAETTVPCTRCHLMMPSAQTGRSVCETTGWCLACTRLPSYLYGYMLAKFLNRNCYNDEDNHLSYEIALV